MIKKNNSVKWIAVYTKPRHEKTVSNELYKKGYEVYLPLLRESENGVIGKNGLNSPYLDLIYLLKPI